MLHHSSVSLSINHDLAERNTDRIYLGAVPLWVDISYTYTYMYLVKDDYSRLLYRYDIILDALPSNMKYTGLRKIILEGA